MIYIGSFSFDGREPNEKGEPVHGFFTCMVESASISKAVEDLAVLIQRLRAQTDTFAGVSRIYLDSCVEVRDVPKDGFVAHFTTCQGPMPVTISSALQGAHEDQVSAYIWQGGDKADEEQTATVQEEPFLVLD